ncbi:unnamed protein product [Trifolium pratense]|uniref:Uncharacterized protein n=1 Tax=Trifolium pratense TaxID=57577 RepID=A0ACB0IJM9_TRIPR|nr:unnamed protein product [Trifolium pratense]
MLLLIFVILFFQFKPWCFLFSSRFRFSINNKQGSIGGDLERPLVEDDVNTSSYNNQHNHELSRDYNLEGK